MPSDYDSCGSLVHISDASGGSVVAYDPLAIVWTKLVGSTAAPSRSSTVIAMVIVLVIRHWRFGYSDANASTPQSS